MTKMFLSLMMMITSIFMLFMSHPLSLGIMILTQTLMICLISGFMINTYWFSYILFLIFIGGLLILFIYISSIASNEMFNLSTKIKFLLWIIIISSMILSLLTMKNLNWLNLYINSTELNNFFNFFLFFNNENMINLTKLYNEQNYLIMIMMIIYLFITLLAVVKIINIFYGPLRSNI
uniref:NADH-ubiquinone oxidoreductase chain 6 n=1 Tax=Heteropterus morpheus TaxID=876081 RepID=A0A0R5DS03_HETMP|nr:NADH dehydrogenase subunit 6 [Heteropterus morpheus]AHH34388.1 NADH dehydrogenase subunit 6 [Heteropterus morpheus]